MSRLEVESKYFEEVGRFGGRCVLMRGSRLTHEDFLGKEFGVSTNK
jgi:hypothetical protein